MQRVCKSRYIFDLVVPEDEKNLHSVLKRLQQVRNDGRRDTALPTHPRVCVSMRKHRVPQTHARRRAMRCGGTIPCARDVLLHVCVSVLIVCVLCVAMTRN